MLPEATNESAETLSGVTSPLAAESASDDDNSLETNNTSNLLVDTSTQTEERKDLECLKCTVEDLMMRITPPPLSKETFTKDELPNLKVLKAVYNHVVADIPTSNSKLKPFQEFVAVLMKLHLNSQMQDLAYRLNISVASISRIFLKWIRVMDEITPFNPLARS